VSNADIPVVILRGGIGTRLREAAGRHRRQADPLTHHEALRKFAIDAWDSCHEPTVVDAMDPGARHHRFMASTIAARAARRGPRRGSAECPVCAPGASVDLSGETARYRHVSVRLVWSRVSRSSRLSPFAT
jgi:hypothetical protein